MAKNEEKQDIAQGSTKLQRNELATEWPCIYLPFTSLRNQYYYSATQNYSSNKMQLHLCESLTYPNTLDCL